MESTLEEAAMPNSCIGLGRRPIVLGAAATALATSLAYGQTTQPARLKKVGFLGAGPKLPRDNPFWVSWFGEMEKRG
jgi:hypothetical protein